MADLFINSGRKYGKISRYLYGHFAEHLGAGIYNGLYVGKQSAIPNTDGIRNDVVEALKKIRVPVIRWPGGSFSEKYHWKDAVGPAEKRRPVVNTSWGGTVEDNSFGTHEFFRLCELVGCDAYLAVNITTGTVQEAADWVDYITGTADSDMVRLRRKNGREEPWKLPWLGIGNENWTMRPEFYSDRFKLFASGLHAGNVSGIKRIACGPDGADYGWTDTVMRLTAPGVMNGLSLHYYTMPGYYKTDEYPLEQKGYALEFDRAGYYRTMRRTLYMEELLRNHCALMERYDPERKVGLAVDEWGTWHLAEPGTNPAYLYQQNTMRDAVAAAVTLNLFNEYSDRVIMANIAQMVNVLQAVILTAGEKMLLTPTYHVFDLYQFHQDAVRIESHIQQDLTGPKEARVPALQVSASEDDNGIIHATVVNLDTEEEKSLNCSLGGRERTSVQVRLISGDMHAYNDFEGRNEVEVKAKPDIHVEANRFSVRMPACSVMLLTIR